MSDPRRAGGPPLSAIALYFLKLGGIGFGGPAALVERMRRDLVDDREWLTAAEFDLGLTIAAACPGPLAYQLAVYCGYVRHGSTGAFAVGIAFALVPFALVSTVAAGYEHWSSSAIIRGLFYGAGPVVVALVARACWNLGRKTLHGAPVAWALCAAGAIVTWLTEREPIWLFALAGVLGVIRLQPHESRRSSPAVPPPAPTRLTSIAGGRDQRSAVRVLLQDRMSCLRQRARDRAISPQRRRRHASLAERAAVSRRRDHRTRVSRPGRHHSDIRRIPGG
jgi:chromate transport protein ChrA